MMNLVIILQNQFPFVLYAGFESMGVPHNDEQNMSKTR